MAAKQTSTCGSYNTCGSLIAALVNGAAVNTADMEPLGYMLGSGTSGQPTPFSLKFVNVFLKKFLAYIPLASPSSVSVTVSHEGRLFEGVSNNGVSMMTHSYNLSSWAM